MKGILIDDIGFRIKKFREKVGYTQQQVSALLNIERSTYSYYELGKTVPDLKTLERLAEIFHEPLSNLLFREEKRVAFSDPGADLFKDKVASIESETEECDAKIEKKADQNVEKKADKSEINIINKISEEEESEESNRNNDKYPLLLSDLSEDEKNMVLYLRMLSPNAQKKVNEIMLEKVKSEDRLGEKFDINNK